MLVFEIFSDYLCGAKCIQSYTESHKKNGGCLPRPFLVRVILFWSVSGFGSCSVPVLMLKYYFTHFWNMFRSKLKQDNPTDFVVIKLSH